MEGTAGSRSSSVPLSGVSAVFNDDLRDGCVCDNFVGEPVGAGARGDREVGDAVVSVEVDAYDPLREGASDLILFDALTAL